MSSPGASPDWTDDVRRTASLMGRARTVLAYGGLDGVVQRPLFHETGTFPQFATAASGCRLVDSTGAEYIDWANGWGPVMLGYRFERVEQAIIEQLSAGPTLSLMHPIEVEVAERICEMVPSAEMVVFGKNGSDVVNAALRVARAVTGREVILQHGFHGFHEWHQVQNKGVMGVPKVLGGLVDSFDYDDIDGLERLLKRRRHRAAAVIMEPTNTFEPPSGYLEAVAEVTHRHGALLIFDEIVTAFRLARGGAQEAYGVLPDLTCVGKSMGNGMPIAALVGRRDLMQVVPATGYGMTFRGETLSLAAARATLETIATEPVTEQLARTGTTMRERFEPIAADAGVPCHLLGPPARMTIGFEPLPEAPVDEIRWTFLQECLRHGVMTNGTLLASYAHDAAAIDETLERMGGALRSVRDRLDGNGTGGSLHPTGGSPFGPRVLTASGFLERADVEGEHLVLEGWLILSDRPPRTVEVATPDGTVIALDLRHGPGGTGPLTPRWRTRFSASIEVDRVATAAGHELELRARAEDGTTFVCPMVLSDAHESSRPTGPFPLADGVLYV